MKTCSHSGTALLAALLLGRVGAWGAERREFFNRSSRDWRITMVEGTRTGVGKLHVIDKFSGNKIASLTRVGDSVAFPAGARYLAEFACENR